MTGWKRSLSANYKPTIGWMFILLSCLCFSLESFAQRNRRSNRDSERSPRQELKYENFNYLPGIRTVQFHPEGDEAALPVWLLGEQDQLLLSFDDLRADIRNFYVSIEHCTADWKSSGLSPLEYVSGYNEERIIDYHSSVNTLQAYTHYQFTFPSPQMKPTRSGNYLLKVYEDADKRRLILTRRLYVVQQVFGMNIQLLPSTNNTLRAKNQKLNLSIQTAGHRITNPYQQIQVLLMQNQRPDVQQWLQQPSFVSDAELRYHDPRTLDFPGGNEFRYVDLRSLHLASERVTAIHRDSLVNITLQTDQNISTHAYGNLYDENGAFFIRNEDRPGALEEADYAQVTFQLDAAALNQKADLNGHKIYVVGGFNDYQRSHENQMVFDQQQQLWTTTIPLKQGLYDYEYVLEDPMTGNVDASFFSGSYFQTGNAYQALIYYRRAGTTWDELWGYQVFP